jgi:hypothetical protein
VAGAPAPAAPPPGPGLRPLPAGPAGPGAAAGRDADLAVAALVTARAFAEVIAGIRPLHHLAGRATPEVYEMLARTMPTAGTAGMTGRQAGPALRVTVPALQEPAPGVAELSAVVFAGTHAEALALRLERRRGRWRCGAVETTLSPRRLRARLTHRPGAAAA